MAGTGGRPRIDLEPHRAEITGLWEAGLQIDDILDTLNSEELLETPLSKRTLERTLARWGLQRKVPLRAEINNPALIECIWYNFFMWGYGDESLARKA